MTDLSWDMFFGCDDCKVMITGTPSEAAAFAVLLIVIILISLALLSKVTGKSFVDLFRL
jgi:hypothetical protein